MRKVRTKHTACFKAKVAMEAIREEATIAEIARRHKLHANVVYKWQRQLVDNMHRAFDPMDSAPSQGR